jgi:DNA-binding MarR family transcriptional regulator
MAGKPRWLSDQEQRAWQSYRLMTRQLESHLARELSRDAGLSMQDYDVLSALTDAPGHRCCAKDLATDLLWSPSRLSHHLDRMQRRELIRREGCAEGPGTDIVLTERGLTAIEAAAPDHVAAVRRVFVDRLSRDDLATLARLSSKVLDALHEASL